MAVRGGHASLLLGLVAMLCPTIAEASAIPPDLSDEPGISISLEPQPLSSAIARLAEQTDLVIYAPSRLLRGRTSNRVVNARSVEEALSALLSSSGLEAVPAPDGGYVLQRRQTQPGPVRSEPPVETPSSQPPEPDIVTVIGAFATGLDRSVTLKREGETILDAIAAAEIGRLPAVNVAEALQRVPGVTITREAGEGQFVGARGLGPIFQTVTLNGAPIAVNENIRNSDQSGRQFRFRVLPADLISGVIVTKAPSADQVEGGIGATIDIITARPLEAAPFASGRAYASHDERSGGWAPNGSMSGAYALSDGRLGFLGGVSYQERQVQFDRLQNFGYDSRDLPGYGLVEAPGSWVMTVEEEQRRRVSSIAAVQWRPTDRIELRAEALYSAFNNTISENRLSYSIGEFAEDGLVPGSARIVNGVLYAGTYEHGRIYRTSEFSDQTHENASLSLAADWQAGAWRVSPRLSVSLAQSRLDTPLQRIKSETLEGDSVQYRFDLGADPVGNRRIEVLTGGRDMTQSDTAPFESYQIRPIASEDRDDSAFLDVEREITRRVSGISLDRLKFGLQATARSRDYQRRDRRVVLKPGYGLQDAGFDVLLPSDAMSGLVGVHDLWSGANFEDFRQAFEVAGEYPGVMAQPDELAPTSDDLRQSYHIEEEILAAYARMDFHSAVSGLPLSGNLGLRWAGTTTRVQGVEVSTHETAGGGLELQARFQTTRHRYQTVLPSLNLALELSEDAKLRLAASRSMTRPSLASLRDSTVPSSATINQIYEDGEAALAEPDLNRRAVGGNPGLDPFVSTNIDLSYERYFESFGHASLSLFHKRIDDYITGEYRPETFVFQTRDSGVLPVEISVNRPRNNGVVTLTGVELGYSGQLASGWGLSASAAYTDSEIASKSGMPLDMARLLGVSELSYSIAPFYQRDRFEAYLSYTWRSAYGVNGNVTIASDVSTGGEDQIIAAGFGTLDFGLSLSLSDRFDLFAEGVNLTDARQAAYEGSRDKPYQIHQYGRTLNLGLRARF